MVGVDEVGRGCWAGPLLVVAAREVSILPENLRDSKLLNRRQREKLLDLLSISCVFGEGWVEVSEINTLGLAAGLKLGVSRALKKLKVDLDEEIIMDGSVNYLPKKFKKTLCLINADSKISIVSAASVYAKVTRDQFMYQVAKKHPGYGFESHVGYGTKMHHQALKDLGVLKNIHRINFKPISSLLEAK